MIYDGAPHNFELQCLCTINFFNNAKDGWGVGRGGYALLETCNELCSLLDINLNFTKEPLID